MKSLLITIFTCITLLLGAQTPPWQWVNTWGGAGIEPSAFSEETTDMAVDSEGNVYVTGKITFFAHFDTTYIQGYGGSDLFLAKYDCGGNLLWAQTAGSNKYESLAFVALDDSGNVYWAGDFDCSGANSPFYIGDTSFCGPRGYFMARVDPASGEVVWAKFQDGGLWFFIYGFTVSGDYLYLNARAIHPSQIAPGQTVEGYYLAKYDLSGNLLAHNNYTISANNPFLRRIAVGPDGSVYAIGRFRDTLLVSGNAIVPNGPLYNGLIVKFNSDLNYVDYWKFSGSGTVGFNDIAINTDNSIALAGNFSDTLFYGSGYIVKEGPGGSGAFTMKLDAAGNGLWAKTSNYQTTSFASYDVVIDKQDNVYMSGHYYVAISFGPDTLRAYNSMEPYFVSYDSAGNYRYAGSVACLGNSRNLGSNIAVDGNGNVFLAGSFGSGIVFQGDTIIRQHGDMDLFLAKFGQPSCAPPCPLPVAGFSVTPNGLSVSLSDSSSGADSISYTAGGPAVTGNVYVFPAPGTYAVCQYAYNTCGADTLCQQVTVACAPPVAGFGTGISELSVSLLDSSALADTVWYTSDGNAINGAFHTFDSTGTYTVCQYAASACGADSLCQQVTVAGVGIGEPGFTYRLYPNPAQGLVTVELPAGSYGFTLYNLLGERIRHQLLGLKNVIDLRGVAAGLYPYLITSSNGQVQAGKLIVE